MASLPSKLRQVLRAAENQLSEHPECVLTLRSRQRIWQALEDESETPSLKGRTRRAVLGVTAVQKVLPRWQEFRPDDTVPWNLLALAIEFIRGRTDHRTARRAANEAWSHADGLGCEQEQDFAILVCYAAATALRVVLDDENFNPRREPPEDLEIVDDPYEMDPAGLASVVAANGFSGDPTSDVRARHQFWTWYLDEGVPEAFAYI